MREVLPLTAVLKSFDKVIIGRIKEIGFCYFVVYELDLFDMMLKSIGLELYIPPASMERFVASGNTISVDALGIRVRPVQLGRC